jgi:hypothetical protein
LKYSKNIDSTKDVFRLPKDILSDRFKIKISGYVPVKKVALATSADEL